jgi:hypothetical protein
VLVEKGGDASFGPGLQAGLEVDEADVATLFGLFEVEVGALRAAFIPCGLCAATSTGNEGGASSGSFLALNKRHGRAMRGSQGRELARDQ